MVELASGAVGLLTVIVWAFWIREVIVNLSANRPCQHPQKATYHSTGNRVCVDCKQIFPIKDNKYAKHQR
jgi:hypothetical protein